MHSVCLTQPFFNLLFCAFSLTMCCIPFDKIEMLLLNLDNWSTLRVGAATPTMPYCSGSHDLGQPAPACVRLFIQLVRTVGSMSYNPTDCVRFPVSYK
uniref:Secreted protein n=1 Tax=Anguilla anguilla TaxID=7936 RepID=A0A0E9WMN8_ANGAN